MGGDLWCGRVRRTFINACSPRRWSKRREPVSARLRARAVDLFDEIEEAGQVSELTVEAQGGIAVKTNTKDGDSGGGIEA